MGGLLILTAVVVPTLLWADLTNAVRLDCRARDDRRSARIGFVDDYLKIVRRIPSRPAAALQDGLRRSSSAWASASRCIVLAHDSDLYNTRLIFPFFKR